MIIQTHRRHSVAKNVQERKRAEMVGSCDVRSAAKTSDQTSNVPAYRHRRRGSRGQALVEFALVAPLFFTLLFGVIEFSLINASVSSFQFATEDAARLGSLLGRSDSTVDTQMVTLIQSHVSGLVVAQIIKIEIYQSNAVGNYILPGKSGPVEDVYNADGTLKGSAGWPPNARNTSLASADYLGVLVTYRYTYLTAFISGGAAALQLTANSVERLEPQDVMRQRSSVAAPTYDMPTEDIDTATMTRDAQDAIEYAHEYR